MDPRAALKLIAITLGFSAVLASAQAQPTFAVTPNQVSAGKSFTLFLEGMTADCYTTFVRESVIVIGKRIDLRYTSTRLAVPLDQPLPTICPVSATGTPSVGAPSAMPNLPTFSMPALEAGKYDVWATDVPECVYNGCMIGMVSVKAGTLEVIKAAEPAYTFTPASAPAGASFDLHLLSYGFSCATLYENQVVHVVGNMITLSFYDKEPTGVACPAVYMPYGPTFRIPALAAGNYQVRVDRNMMSASITAGNLQVTGTAPRKGWYLKQKTVPPDAAFQMHLLQAGLPACPEFSHLNTVVTTKGIDVSFYMQLGKCAAFSPEPIGPLFSMPGLKTGIYPVFVTELAACEVSAPLCIILREMPVSIDTLVVAKTLSMPMSALRAGAPKAELRGNTAYITLPEGKPGVWRAELMTLDGRVLADKSLTGASGTVVSMPVERAPANAVSLLRLTSPSGTQRWLPMLR